jgi:hypothetical protein
MRVVVCLPSELNTDAVKIIDAFSSKQIFESLPLFDRILRDRRPRCSTGKSLAAHQNRSVIFAGKRVSRLRGRRDVPPYWHRWKRGS